MFKKWDGNVLYIDAEQALDKKYCIKLGVDVNKLVLSQESIAETALITALKAMESGVFKLVVIDSVAALMPKAVDEKEIGEVTVAQLPRILSSAMPKLVTASAKNKCSLLFINQVRDLIGQMGYGPKTSTPGGRALKFAASLRLEVNRMGSEKDGDTIVSNKTKVKAVKNKISTPYLEGITFIEFNKGINPYTEIAIMAEEYGIIKKAGQTFYFSTDKDTESVGELTERIDGDKDRTAKFKICTYKKNLSSTLEKNPEAFEIIKDLVIKAIQTSDESEYSNNEIDEENLNEENIEKELDEDLDNELFELDDSEIEEE